ncbi:leucine-rich repeat domain-containing protein, partial [Xylanibacter brevis]|uniref:leucine-rich repeat domain-containing protein n=1 Tax=Xylanibacter brevis TaxID=83231 RepID=UPI0012DCC073
MKNSIKREQSQACLNFAERKNFRLQAKHKILMTLALLITAVGGAWAQGPWTSSDCTVTLNNGTLTVSGNGAMADYSDPSDRPWDGNSGDITSVVVESGVTSVGFNAFESISNLTSVTLPEGLTSIGSSAFYDCRSLQSITIPSTVTSIGDGAFWNCSAMTSVTLPEGLTVIGTYAFTSCSSLTSITIPSTVTSIGDYAFMLSSVISDVNLYANPDNLTWGDASYDFKSGKATQCHVLAEHLSTYQNNFSSANVTFVGDLKPLATSAVEVTTNKAENDTVFTEAWFNMPAFDATAEYE